MKRLEIIQSTRLVSSFDGKIEIFLKINNYLLTSIFITPDAEELRKSQRRPRPSDLGHSNPSNPSQESDFDEDIQNFNSETFLKLL